MNQRERRQMEADRRLHEILIAFSVEAEAPAIERDFNAMGVLFDEALALVREHGTDCHLATCVDLEHEGQRLKFRLVVDLEDAL